MKIFLVKHGGPTGVNRKIRKTGLFLKNLCLDPVETILLFAPCDMARESAKIINKELKLKNIKKEERLRFNRSSSKYQIMELLFYFYEAENIIIVGNRKEIACTVDVFADMIIPDKLRKDLKVKPFGRGSVYFIDTFNAGGNMERVKKIFSLSPIK